MLGRFVGRDTPLLSRYRVAPEGDWVSLTHSPSSGLRKDCDNCRNRDGERHDRNDDSEQAVGAFSLQLGPLRLVVAEILAYGFPGLDGVVEAEKNHQVHDDNENGHRNLLRASQVR